MKKILLSTFYSGKGGSVFILIKSAEILKKKFDIIFKAPLKEADIENHRLPCFIAGTDKIKHLPKLVYIFLKELLWVYRNKIDIIYVHDTPSLYIYGLIGKILNKKVIYHVHDHNIQRSNRKRYIKLSDFRIYLNENLVNKNDRNYKVIPNFVEDFGINKGSKKIKIISIVGSICDRKNQIFGVQIMEKLEDKKLYLYGNIIDDNYYKKIEKYIDNKRVFLKGFRDKKEILSTTDLIFIPSKYEAQPLVFLEAIANAIPVLAADIDGVRDIAKKIGYEKYLYKEDNIDDCIEKLYLIEKEFFEKKDIFRERIKEIYSLEIFEKKLIETFLKF